MNDAAIDDNLDRIRSDLVCRGVTYDPLIDDLLDHICCLVEDNMNTGSDFESSYDRVMESIGEKRLPEIQHQTLLNLDKKFQRMKNFTYLFGLTSALLTIVGAFFKKMHWPGAGILITVGIVLVVLVFLPLYFLTNYREQVEKKNPVYAIVGYLTLAFLMAGALFKIMHWPGANIMIQAGLGVLIIGFIPLYVVNAFQRGGKEKVRLPYIAMLLVGISIVMLFANLNMSKYLLDIYMKEAISNEHMIGEVQGRTAQLLEMVHDSAYADKQDQVVKIHDQARDLQVMIQEMKESLLALADQPGVPIEEVKVKDKRRNRWESRSAFEKEQEFMLEARQFREMLNEMLLDPVVRGQIEDHLEFTGKVWGEEFGIRISRSEPLMQSYYKLTDISMGIALTECVAIQYILEH
jgi:hypothetical protein